MNLQEQINKMQNIMGVIKEDETSTTDLTPNFFKTTYIPEDKSIIGAYTITNETDNMIEVLNIKETLTDKGVYMDGADPYIINISKVKLPKSQIEIIGDVEGKEGFKYIKIPYWLFKKLSTDLNVKRYDKLRRINFTHSQRNDNEFLKLMNDPEVIKHLTISNPDNGTTEVWSKSIARRYE